MAVAAAFERTQSTVRYHFQTDIIERQIPAATLNNIGRQGKQRAYRIEGTVNPIEQRIDLTLFDSNGPATQLRIDKGQTYVHIDSGEWKALDNNGQDGPFTSALAYLHAARAVKILGSERQGDTTLAHYQFELDGQRYAEYIRDETRRWREQQDRPLPPGLTYDPPAQLRGMTGRGEVWVQPDGLPTRQIIDAELPDNAGQGTRFQSNTVYAKFEQSSVASASIVTPLLQFIQFGPGQKDALLASPSGSVGRLRLLHHTGPGLGPP